MTANADAKLLDYELHRRTMIEYRITFGWGQPHGPSPEKNTGKYVTIWAPHFNVASDMAIVRYDEKWAHLYFPQQWKSWSWVMDGCEELEVLQYDSSKKIPVYPERDPAYPDCVYGHGHRDGSRARSLYS